MAYILWLIYSILLVAGQCTAGNCPFAPNQVSAASSSSCAGSSASSSASSSAGSYEDESSESREIDKPPANVCFNVPKPCDEDEIYRRIDGSCNNVHIPEWGMAEYPYSSLLPPAYSDGISAARRANDNSSLPSARKVRLELFPVGRKENEQLTLLSMQFGQVVAHDMSLLKDNDEVPCCTEDGQLTSQPDPTCLHIVVPEDDPTQGKAGISCMNFTRTLTDRDMGCGSDNKPAKKINLVTPYLDLSIVYGNNEEASASLRSMKDGRLKVEMRDNKMFPPNVDDANISSVCKCNKESEKICYKTGDKRNNQSPHLAILQILLLREHNRIADGMKNNHDCWDDEKIFQEARRLNIAQYQYYTYYQWMPQLLGSSNLMDAKIIYPYSDRFVNDYDDSTDPFVSNEHAHAAYRFFHSQIASMLKLINGDRETVSQVKISDFFSRPVIIEDNNSMTNLTYGLISQMGEDADQLMSDAVVDQMSACRSEGFGDDLKSFDIQRDRDHGLRYYIDYRKYCGLRVPRCFDDFKDLISSKNVAILKKLYKSYRDVDLSVAGALEKRVSGAQVGPTFLCILQEQFRRTRKSDRFWFENEYSGFNEEQLMEIRKASMARLICDNLDEIEKIQVNPFVKPSKKNPMKKCQKLPSVNLLKF